MRALINVTQMQRHELIAATTIVIFFLHLQVCANCCIEKLCQTHFSRKNKRATNTGDNHVTCGQLSKPDVATLSYRRSHY